ncbi:ankyrin repeat protein [Pseudomonas chlororaphis]|uniref:hypothetical protein n=1 Tax=Pseudomonas chlororaphis TaxID=587753 RepID=UPI00209F704D|nr:hypothetical protein [Pseudomonas chlororaphis]MCP1596272.1 ankyrin repeat protein [Pseudomonas chlororaphis]
MGVTYQAKRLIKTQSARISQGIVVDWLLQQGADPERPNNKGTTPLMYAKDAYLAGRCRKTFQLLLRKGARLEAADHCGRALADYVTDEQFAQLRGAF